MANNVYKPLIPQGWLRAIVFFVLYMIIAIGASTLLQRVLPSGADVKTSTDPVGAKQRMFLLGVTLLTALTFGVVWAFRKFVDRQSFYSLGFAWKNNTGYAATGALAAVAMLGIGTLVLMATGHLSFSGWNGNMGYLLTNMLLMIVVAFMEELTFRGYLLNNLMQSMNKWMALGISALVFTFIHLDNPGAGILPIVEIFIAGVMLGINYIYTRNLWFGIALHFAWNFLQGPVLGYQVSGNVFPSLLQQEISGPAWLTGGAFGFEGSVLAMILNIALIGLLVWFYNRRQINEPLIKPA